MDVRLRIAVAAAALVLGAARSARADGAADLEKAHNAYVAHQFPEAEARLRALLDPASGSLVNADDVADARMYLGATLVSERRPEEAQATFTQLLTDKPDYQPDALRVSLDAIDAFTDARTRARDKLATLQADRVRKAQEERARAEAERQRQARRLAMLEQLASTERVTERGSRWVALVPFGVGQFQNNQRGLGWTLLVSEGLLAAGSGVGAALTYYDVVQRNDAISHGQQSVANGYMPVALERVDGELPGGRDVLEAVQQEQFGRPLLAPGAAVDVEAPHVDETGSACFHVVALCR